MHAVDGHCMRIDERSDNASAERVDGHPAERLSLSARVLMKRFSISANDGVRRDGCTDKVESSREGTDGSKVQDEVGTEECLVVGRSMVHDPATSTTTALLSGTTAFPTCTSSPHTAAYLSHRQVHSTTRAVARTNTTYHATPPSPGSPGATVVRTAELEERRTAS